MAIQDTPRVVGMSAIDVAKTPPKRMRKPPRHLPVHKDWPTWIILTTQIGILIAFIGLWETAARSGWISSFFLSQPSAIWKTLNIFFTEGDAWTHLSYTFSSTLLRFTLRTVSGS